MTAPAKQGATTGRRPGLLTIVAGLAILVSGFLDGRYVAYLNSRPNYFVRLDMVLVVAATIVGAAVVAFVVRSVAQRQAREPGAIRSAVWIGIALLIAGFAAGAATAAATGALHREPVVLETVGKAAGDFTLAGFVASGDQPATCRSVADGTAVEGITGLDLGSLAGATFRTFLTIDAATGAVVSGEVFVDGGDLPEGSGQPSWTGTMTTAELAPDGRNGRVDFESLQLINDPPPGAQPNGDPWPSTLAGSVRWICGDWIVPEG
jgi:hypothetical protein